MNFERCKYKNKLIDIILWLILVPSIGILTFVATITLYLFLGRNVNSTTFASFAVYTFILMHVSIIVMHTLSFRKNRCMTHKYITLLMIFSVFLFVLFGIYMFVGFVFMFDIVYIFYKLYIIVSFCTIIVFYKFVFDILHLNKEENT